MKAISLVLGLSGLLVMTGCKGSEAAPAPEAPAALVGARATDAGAEAVSQRAAVPFDPALILDETGETLRSGQLEPRFADALTKWGEAVDRLGVDLVYWVRQLDGHMKPMTMVKVSGQPLIKGYVCEMWACGMNEVVYLMWPDQSRIVGIAKLDEDKPQRTEYLIGNPTAEETRCLRFYLDHEDDDSDC